MDSEDYVKHIRLKYATNIAIAIIKSKPKDTTLESYLQMLRNSIESGINFDIDICSDDFDFDEDIFNIIEDNDVGGEQTQDLTQITVGDDEGNGSNNNGSPNDEDEPNNNTKNISDEQLNIVNNNTNMIIDLTEAEDISSSTQKNCIANDKVNIINNSGETTKKSKANDETNNNPSQMKSSNNSVDLLKQINYTDVATIAFRSVGTELTKPDDTQATILYDYKKLLKKPKITTNITDILGISYVDKEVGDAQNVVPNTQNSVTAQYVGPNTQSLLTTQNVVPNSYNSVSAQKVVPIAYDSITTHNVSPHAQISVTAQNLGPNSQSLITTQNVGPHSQSLITTQNVVPNSQNSVTVHNVAPHAKISVTAQNVLSIVQNPTNHNAVVTLKTAKPYIIQRQNDEINRQNYTFTQNELMDIQNEIATQISDCTQDGDINDEIVIQDAQIQEMDTQYQTSELQSTQNNEIMNTQTWLTNNDNQNEAMDTQYQATEQQTQGIDTQYHTAEQQTQAIDTQYQTTEQQSQTINTQYQPTEQQTQTIDTQYQATEAIDTQTLLDYSQNTHISQSQDNEKFDILEKYVLGKAKSIEDLTPENVINDKPNDINNDGIPFKVLDKLNKIKFDLRRNEGCSYDSGYRSDTQSQKLILLNTSMPLYNAGECLFNYLLECSITQRTDVFIEEVSTVFGEYIDNLHTEEKYPPFLELILEKIKDLLQEIYTTNSYGDDEISSKSNSFTRLLLLNRSQNIITYTIGQVIDYIEEMYNKIINKENNYELENTHLVENLCYVFSLLEVLLKRYIKKEDQQTRTDESISPISNTITRIWKQRWEPDFSEKPAKVESKSCIAKRCGEVLKRIIMDCMEDFSLVSFAALQCFNSIQD